MLKFQAMLSTWPLEVRTGFANANANAVTCVPRKTLTCSNSKKKSCSKESLNCDDFAAISSNLQEFLFTK